MTSTRAHQLAPILDGLGCAADVSPAEAVSTPSIEGADVAAFGIDVGEFDRFAEPVGADAGGVMNTSTEDSAEVAPPTVETKKLAHISY